MELYTLGFWICQEIEPRFERRLTEAFAGAQSAAAERSKAPLYEAAAWLTARRREHSRLVQNAPKYPLGAWSRLQFS